MQSGATGIADHIALKRPITSAIVTAIYDLRHATIKYICDKTTAKTKQIKSKKLFKEKRPYLIFE